MTQPKHPLLDLVTQACSHLKKNYNFVVKPSQIKKDVQLRSLLKQIEPLLDTIFTVNEPKDKPSEMHNKKEFKALTWNIERGKNLKAILECFNQLPQLQHADFILLTEVDWGMARSGNFNVAAEIAKSLGYYAYFTPSFFGLTRGHGVEVECSGDNELGLHGKAILSKYPLTNLSLIKLPNLTKVLRKKDARIGNKRVLIGHFQDLCLACVHLDAYSSPKSRARQMKPVVETLKTKNQVLLAGDWNTNTHNTTHTPGLAISVLKQLIIGPKKVVTQKYANTHLFFDKPLFDFLKNNEFEFESFNELGVSTFDLFIDAQEMGAMAAERLPMPLINGINKLIKRFGGHIPLKLDWFAAKNLKATHAKVIKIPKKLHLNDRPASDHHPICCEFKL